VALERPAGLRDPNDQLRRQPASLEERQDDERLREAGGPRPPAAGGDLHEPDRARRATEIVLGAPTACRGQRLDESERAPEPDEPQTNADRRQEDQREGEERPVVSRKSRNAEERTR
jgi:hypothetical protein